MVNKNLLYPVIVGLVIIGLVWYLSNYFGYKQYTSEHSSTCDTIWIKQDTVWKNKLIEAKKIPARIDTVLIEGKLTEVAISDTVVTVDSSRIWARYYGSPYNFFDIYANIKEKIITNTKYITETVYAEESFWDKFGISLQAGAGYGLINRKPDIYVGAGAHFKLK